MAVFQLWRIKIQLKPQVSPTPLVVTWNVRELRQPNHRLGRLTYDVILQETHMRNEKDRSTAQKDWTRGLSLWSYHPDGLGGVAVLTCWRSKFKAQTWMVVSPRLKSP